MPIPCSQVIYTSNSLQYTAFIVLKHNSQFRSVSVSTYSSIVELVRHVWFFKTDNTIIQTKTNTITPSAHFFLLQWISGKVVVLIAPEWRSGLRHCISVPEVPTTVPGLNPGCITSGCDWESHRAAHNWPSVARV